MYELMVLTNRDQESAISKVEKLLKELAATEIKLEKLGVKTLAYPIKKQTEGEYFLFNFNGPGQIVADIQNNLRLEQEQILRYLITSVKISKKKIKVSIVSKAVEQEIKERAKVTVSTKTKASAKVTVKTKVKKSKVHQNQITTDN